jgi:hypothetical protein
LTRLRAAIPTDPPPGGLPPDRVPSEDSGGSGVLEIADSKPSLPRRSSRTVVGVAAVVISAVIGVLLGLSINNNGEPQTMTTAIHASETSLRPKTVQSDTLVKTAPHTAPDESKETAPEAEIPSFPPDKAMQETVTVDIKGLPRGARVTVDGLIQKLPLTLSRSEKPKVLKVKAKGYLPHRQTIVPSRDNTLSIEMKAVKVEREPETDNINSRERGEKKWRSNPFADES